MKKSAPRKRKKAKNVLRPKPQPAAEYRISHKEILLATIGKGRRESTKEALAFACALSSVTPSMQDLAVREGITFGKALYKHLGTRESWPYSVEVLANFFNRAGYRQLTYKPLPLRFRMELNRNNEANLGSAISWFEGGMISGFIAASGGRHIHVSETECAYSGGQSCAFEYHFDLDNQRRTDGPKLIENLSRMIDESLTKRKTYGEKAFDSAYVMMLYQPLFSKAYKPEILRIAHFVGIKMGLRSKQRVGGNVARAANYIEKTTSLLSFGKASIKAGKRMSALVSFDHMHSRNDFVDIVASLISGIMVGWGKNPTITKSSLGGKYRLTITG